MVGIVSLLTWLCTAACRLENTLGKLVIED